MSLRKPTIHPSGQIHEATVQVKWYDWLLIVVCFLIYCGSLAWGIWFFWHS